MRVTITVLLRSLWRIAHLTADAFLLQLFSCFQVVPYHLTIANQGHICTFPLYLHFHDCLSEQCTHRAYKYVSAGSVYRSAGDRRYTAACNWSAIVLALLFRETQAVQQNSAILGASRQESDQVILVLVACVAACKQNQDRVPHLHFANGHCELLVKNLVVDRE